MKKTKQKRLKSAVSGAVIGAVIICGASAAFAGSQPSDWASETVEHAKSVGLLGDEYDQTGIRLDDYTAPISREEFCELIYRLLLADRQGLEIGTMEPRPDDPNQSWSWPPRTPFTDTDNYYVKVLYSAEIIYGKSETQFAPNDSLTREEAATILTRALDKYRPIAPEERVNAGKNFTFSDDGEISDWAKEPVKSICEMGIMRGVGENRFAPKQVYTKEQAIVTAAQAYDATTEVYTYDTPLGVYTSHINGESGLNFAIACNAWINLYNNGDDASYTGSRKVRALTDLMWHSYISFDDFADIFGGSWSMEDNRLSFTYDASKPGDIGEAVIPDEGPETDWPNKKGKLDIIALSDIKTIMINGEEKPIHYNFGGKIYDGNPVMYGGELYLPTQMAAELTDGYEMASLRVVWSDPYFVPEQTEQEE